MKTALTELVVRNTKAPAEVGDLTVPGFGVRIGKRERTYFLMHRDAERVQRRLTIGSAATMTLAEARRIASERREGKRETGRDPLPFREAAERWLRQHPVSPKTREERRSMMDHDAIPAFGSRPVDAVTRREVIALVDEVVERGAPVQANRVFEMLRAFFNWCVSKDIIERSPCDGAKRPTREESRERSLTPDEVRRFWRATEATGGFRDLFRLMLVTAQRESEVGKMRWSEVDLDARTWMIPAGRAKNDRAHEVHLTDQAVEILDARERRSSFVFPSARPNKVNVGRTALSGFSRAKLRLDAAMEPDEPWKLHDLRRTVTTMLAEAGVPPHVADRVLNHRSGTIKGVARVYNRYDYRREARQALEAWSDRLSAIVGA